MKTANLGLSKLRQEDHKYDDSLGYALRKQQQDREKHFKSKPANEQNPLWDRTFTFENCFI